MALPYLMEYPHECSEQTFNRLYANALARHVAASDPKVRRVFDRWKNTPALDSPLVKNQDLKAVTIEETPWLRDADKESEARRNVGVLFDDNRLTEETGRSFFLGDKPFAPQHQDALAYWKRQAKNYWLQLANRQSQAHIAVGLKRFGDKETAVGIMKSIKERSVSSEELGLFWRDTELSW